MIVVDAAVVIDVLTRPRGSEALRDLIVDADLHAPALLEFEVVSGLRGLTLGGHVSADRALDALGDYDDLPIRIWPSAPELRRRAFGLRDNVSAYDAAYIALAEALECPLVTRDARLSRTVGHDAVVQVL